MFIDEDDLRELGVMCCFHFVKWVLYERFSLIVINGTNDDNRR